MAHQSAQRSPDRVGHLAVFDLDGTITRRDTLLPYVLGFVLRAPWRLPRLLLFLPTVAAFALGLADRGALKGAFIRSMLGGCERSDIESWTARFVPKLLARGLYGDALEQIAAHRRDGGRLVLLSASTDLYVPEIARALRFDSAICTEVRWDGERLIGDLASANRRGAEKTRCFLELRRQSPEIPAAAYGNAWSDLDHLRLADHPLLVNASARARRAANQIGIPCARWR